MIILGIETSCDETSAAVIKTYGKEKKVKLLSNVISSSISLHSKTGGIIPEVAAREQVKFIIPVIDEALKVLKNPKIEVDAIAVTVGPGLIGSLLVGVETARILSYVWKKPLVAVNHLFGHIYANWIENGKKEIKFPAISLIVSGGHTDLVLMKNHNEFKWLGGTRDDAAGEAFDKAGRLLGLSYPAGPEIEKLAKNTNKDLYDFPRPMIGSDDFDFSFSGLKTAVLREVEKIGIINLKEENKINISYSLQEAVFDVLIKKTFKAYKKYDAKSIVLGGGVSASQTLTDKFERFIEKNKLKVDFFVPEKTLCTDNAAMIASASFYKYEEVSWKNLSANPELYFD
ncbi:MAG TPA: tRNA (adenosine(37)-N6)-threonylcarbamoyltransferase complex transferase subunit TsaD [Candidatus Sulfotelmatobacter sp.]|nr:tRNA (adenosine(37)-N6)-threonylcarbamoyltransferase complex transferase subunit TsaD [Candidatus Sulfotelmatobacter sp.]